MKTALVWSAIGSVALCVPMVVGLVVGLGCRLVDAGWRCAWWLL